MRLIDADALLQRAVSHGWSTPKWVSDIVINDAPTIEAEPVKHGQWKLYPIADDCWQCSVCGILRMGSQSNYCPNCGCFMKEDKKVGTDR